MLNSEACGSSSYGHTACDFVEHAVPLGSGQWTERLKKVMADIAGVSRSAQVHFAVADNRASDARADEDTENMLASDSRAEFPFAVHRSMHIVAHGNFAGVWRKSLLERKTGECGEIGRRLNRAFVCINGAGESDAYTGNKQPPAGILHERLNRHLEGTLEVFRLFGRLDFEAVNYAETVIE